MRKNIIISAITAVTVMSCQKSIQDIVVIRKAIEYKYETEIPNVPRNGGAFPTEGISVPFPKYTVVTNSSAFMKDNNLDSAVLNSVKPGTLTLSLLQPVTGSLNYIDSLRVYVSANNLPEQLAAYKYGITGATKIIDLTCQDVELRSYFLKDSMYFRVVAHFTNYPDSNSRVEIKTALNVVAQPLKKTAQ